MKNLNDFDEYVNRVEKHAFKEGVIVGVVGALVCVIIVALALGL